MQFRKADVYVREIQFTPADAFIELSICVLSKSFVILRIGIFVKKNVYRWYKQYLFTNSVHTCMKRTQEQRFWLGRQDA